MAAASHDILDEQGVSFFPAIWYRDNCGCEECRDPRSNQKRFTINELPVDTSVAIVESNEVGIVVELLPDHHRSVFTREWLAREAFANVGDGRSEQSKRLWSAADLDPSVQHAEWSIYCRDATSRLNVLRGIEVLGFAILHGTPVTERTVLDIAKTFGFVRDTNYGELFDVRVESNPNNLAFTSGEISPHTDNPYRDPVPTMQLLHCLSNDVDGGESGLVDGFRAATILRDERPRYFDILTRTPLTFAWSDEKAVLRAERPMIELDVNSRVRGVRFNNRSLQTVWLDGESIAEFYEAYRYFAEIIARPEHMLTFRLDSGDCVVFDNTRILHARTAFEETDVGQRHLQGCYADLDGLASTVSVLKRELEI
jgi:gamma-butyrobetaine dioxygenase